MSWARRKVSLRINPFRVPVYFLLVSLVLVCANCKVKRPADVIPEDIMEQMLYDYHLAQSLIETLPSGESYKKPLYFKALFNKYGIEEEVFDSSLMWYVRNGEKFSKMCNRVRDKLRKQRGQINSQISLRDNKPLITSAGDSVDVWPWARLVRLRGAADQNRYTFLLPVDTNYLPRDTLVWESNFHFVGKADSLQYAIAAMQAIYEKDTISTLYVVDQSGKCTLRLYADTLGTIQTIKGFIYYPALSFDTPPTLLVDGLRLMRYHCQDSLSFHARDSINRLLRLREDSIQHLRNDSDEVLIQNQGEDAHLRQDPNQMNRRRTGAKTEKKEEQIQVERHIEQEKAARRKARQKNRRATKRK